jgi:branched-chain amino acid transport system permease protein
MSDLLQLLVAGVAVGGVYALVAVGLVTVFNVTGVINFAQGEFAMVGAMTAASLVERGMSLAPAVLVAVAAAAAIGWATYRGALVPARRASDVSLIIITIGVSIALRGLALLAWGSQPLAVPPFSAGPPVDVGGAVLSRQDLWVLGLTVLVMLGLAAFFGRTLLGAALRATAMNRDASRLVGISPRAMGHVAFTLAAALAALAGVAIAPLGLATFDMGLMLGLKGFVAAVMGGLTSAPAAVLSALLLGVLESLGAGFVSSGYKDASAFVILVGVLLLRPHGLTAAGAGRRA